LIEAPGVVVDYGSGGMVIGIEILDFSPTSLALASGQSRSRTADFDRGFLKKAQSKA
jgi:hypothetical protein